MGLRAFAVLCSLLVFAQACDCRGRAVVAAKGDLQVSPQALDFGTVLKGTRVQRTLTAKNTGKVAVAVDGLHFDGDARGAFSTALAPFTLGAGGTHDLVVFYVAPAAGGADDADLVLLSGGDELRVPVNGFSLARCDPGQTDCGLTCADLSTDPNNCGACGVACGSCANGACVCLKKVCGTQCGPVSDGCGGMLDCGACPVPDAGTCVPTTCQAAGAICGALSDGCGGTLNCGGCTNGSACTAHQCVCASQTEVCGDGVDNNCDGNVDCVDPQCVSLPACAQQPCTVTDPEVQLTNANDGSNGAAILWTGTSYGVFWMNDAYRYGFARLDPSLAVLTAPALVTGTTMAHRPFPVWTGSMFGIGWSDTRAGALQYSNEVYFNRFHATTGVPMAGTDLGVSTGPGMAFPSATGWNAAANEYGVLYADEGTAMSGGNQRRMYFQRIDASGQMVGAKQKVSPAALTDGTGDYGDLKWSGSNWGAAWTERRNGAGPHIYFSRLTAAGVPEPTDTQVSAGASYGYLPRVATSGSAFGVAYTDARGTPLGSDIWFQRFDATGTNASASRAVTASGKARGADLVWTGANWAVVYSDTRGGYDRIYYAKLDVDGNKVGPEQLLSCLPKQAMAPSVAFDGTKLAVAFAYMTGGSGQVYVKRFSP